MLPNRAGKYSRNVMAWSSAATIRRAAWNSCSSVAWQGKEVNEQVDFVFLIYRWSLKVEGRINFLSDLFLQCSLSSYIRIPVA